MPQTHVALVGTLTLALLPSLAGAPLTTPEIQSAPRGDARALCEGLRGFVIPNGSVTTAELVAVGPMAVPAAGQPAGRAGGGAAAGAVPTMLPAHCRVAATLRPSADSSIDIEAWMPANGWNGKFQAVGNGGWAGAISYGALATALQDGYAAASTDTGHKGGNALFAIDHPEKLVDFAYRAVHEMTVQAKAIIAQFYARGPRLSYWNGCSTGGRQGLMSAQRYPADFDAIVAGAPANYQTHLHAWDLAASVPALLDPAAAVPASKLAMVNRAVLAACDATDGVADGILNDPAACQFDVASLQCQGADTEACLTAPQVSSVRRVYAPAHTRSGQVVFAGKAYGAETGFGAYIGGQNAPAVSVGSFQVAFGNPNWDWRTFDLDHRR
jgi:feruloyl esterase